MPGESVECRKLTGSRKLTGIRATHAGAAMCEIDTEREGQVHLPIGVLSPPDSLQSPDWSCCKTFPGCRLQATGNC